MKEFKTNNLFMISEDNNEIEFIQDYKLLPRNYKYTKVFIKGWLKKDGDYVKKGDIIYKLGNMSITKPTLNVEAPIDGYLEIFKCEYSYINSSKPNYLNEGEKICTIYKSIDKLKINSLIKKKLKDDNEVDFIYSNKSLPKIYKNVKVFIGDWLKKDGDFIKKGDILCRLGNVGSLNVEAPIDGYLEIFKYEYTFTCSSKPNYLNEGEKICTIYKSVDKLKINSLIKKKLKNVPIISQDPFDKKTNIKWEILGNNRFSEKILNETINMISSYPDINRLFLTVNYIDEKDYLIIRHPKKDYLLNMGDSFQILFDNGDILKFEINKKSFFMYESYSDGFKKLFENRIILFKDDLIKLKNNLIKDWRITINDNRVIEKMEPYGGEHNYNSYEDLQKALNLLFNDYYDIVNTIEDYKPLEKFVNHPIPKINNEECYLYIMKDSSNGYYKIGISKKPEHRERTLQGEKPTIEMINNKKFAKRKIAISIEKSLHQTYSAKRIRGEWFDLNDEDIEDISSIMN